MIVRRFLLWARSAPAGQRADAVSALARTYLYSPLADQDRADAETALTVLLDDPAPIVRRAIAEALANAADAPRHIVLALASDQSDIAALVLSRSPVLTDADLVDCAALGDEFVQTAIALRMKVTRPVSAALAEIGAASAVLELIGNPCAEIGPSSLARIHARFGANADIREALLARADLPLSLRQAIAVSIAESLSAFVVGRGWLSAERCERVTRESRERTTIALTGAAEPGDVEGLVAHLRESGQLTPALLLRALLSRGVSFAEAAFAELADMPVARVSGLLHDRRGAGFAALFRKAGLPAGLEPAFRAALAALSETKPQTQAENLSLSRRMVERVLSACADIPPEEAGKLLALLRRFEAEAAREEARILAEALIDDAALDAALNFVETGIAVSVREQRYLSAA